VQQKTTRNPWKDPVGYPCFVSINGEDCLGNPISLLSNYVQYTQTIFSKPEAKTLSFRNGVHLTSIDQTQFSEFDKTLEELRDFGYEVADSLVELGNRCSKTGYFQKCSCGKMNFKPRFSKGINHKRICSICNRARAKSLGRTKNLRTWALKPDYVAHLVLTLPDTHHKYCNRNNSKWLMDTHNYLFSKAKEFIGHFFKGFGFDGKVHTWASKAPLSSPHWHIHCMIPLVKIENGKKIQRNGHVTKEYLSNMRDYWRQIIGWDSEVNINYSFARLKDEERTGKIRHWYNYIARGAICDINEYLLSHKDMALTDSRKKWFNFHTDPVKRNFKELRSFGSLAECNISKFLTACNSSLKTVHEWIRREIIESKKLYCRCCGVELDPTLWEYHECFILRTKFAVSTDKWNQFRGVVS